LIIIGVADIPAITHGILLSILFALDKTSLAYEEFDMVGSMTHLAISIAPALHGVVQIIDGAAGLPG